MLGVGIYSLTVIETSSTSMWAPRGADSEVKQCEDGNIKIVVYILISLELFGPSSIENCFHRFPIKNCKVNVTIWKIFSNVLLYSLTMKIVNLLESTQKVN